MCDEFLLKSCFFFSFFLWSVVYVRVGEEGRGLRDGF